ncbi:MAG: DUF192 domain-containing protein [Salinarchaeum sp.]
MIGAESSHVLRHTPADGEETTLAETVHIADTWVARAIGLIGRQGLKANHALVFSFTRACTRHIHTVGVRAAIDAIWCVGSQVTQVRTLAPWRGLAGARADTVIELPAGAAAAVAVGDRVCME